MRKVIVTGSNRGLGFSLVKQICKLYPETMVIMTARNEKRGLEAMESLKKGFEACNLDFFPLDVSNTESIKNFKRSFEEKYKNFDVLVNNAGIGNYNDVFDDKGVEDPEVVKETLACNFFGLIEITETLLPLMSDDGKIISYSSLLGELQFQPERVKKILVDPDLSKDRLFELTKEFAADCRVGKKIDKKYWAPHAYHLSKCLINSYTRFVLPRMLGKNQSAFALKPGWCATEMGTKYAPLTPEDGTVSCLKLIFKTPFGKDEKMNGKFFDEAGDITDF